MLFIQAVKIGELLRNRQDRTVWLVIHKTKQGIFVVNLMIKNNNPAHVDFILPGYIEDWDRDTEIDDLEEWEKEAIECNIQIIEQLESPGLDAKYAQENEHVNPLSYRMERIQK